MPGNLPTRYPDPLVPLPRVGLGGKLEEVRVDSSAGFQLRRLAVRPEDRSGSTDPGPVVCPKRAVTVPKKTDFLLSPSVHVSDRAPHGNGEAGVVRSSPHETHPMALGETLACSGESGKGHSSSPVSPSSPRLVVAREQCAAGPAFAPTSARSSNLYRRLKRRLGRSLRRSHSKRRLVGARKSPAYKFSRAQGRFSGPQEFRASLQGPDCSDSNRQHNCGFLHQQGGRYEIRLSLCPPLETSVLVPSQANSSQGKTHSGALERDSGQTTQSSDPVIK